MRRGGIVDAPQDLQPAGGTIDLTDHKILLSLTRYTSSREKKCCNILLNGDCAPSRTVGHRFDAACKGDDILRDPAGSRQ